MTYKGTCKDCYYHGFLGHCLRHAPVAGEEERKRSPWTHDDDFCGDGELATEPHSDRKPTMRQEIKEMNLEDEMDDALEAFANMPHREPKIESASGALLTVAQEAYQCLRRPLPLDIGIPDGLHNRLAAAIVACGGSLEEDDEGEPCKYCNGTGKVNDIMGIGDECECAACEGKGWR